MQRLHIEHLTEYHFHQITTLLPHRLLLRPRENHAVRIASSKLEITPTPIIRWQRDALDNAVALATFTVGAVRLAIKSTVVIEHHEEWPLDFVVEADAVTHPFNYAPTEAVLLAAFLQPSWPGDRAAVASWLSSCGLGLASMETFVLLDRMNRTIHDSFRYEVREQAGVQSPSQTLARGAGSCRDFAALFMEGCRHLGLASRFVSGYLHSPDSAPPPPTGGATHAWAEVYLPGPGWKGFDPTGGQIAGRDHIAVAVAQHPEHVPPVAGSFLGSAGQQPVLVVSVRVQPWHQ